MSDYDLRVLTDHIHELAQGQQAAAGRIKIATESIHGLSGKVWRTHGIICAATNLAVSTAESARAAAGNSLYKQSEDLKDRLNYAAQNYNDTDWREGRNIGACSV